MISMSTPARGKRRERRFGAISGKSGDSKIAQDKETSRTAARLGHIAPQCRAFEAARQPGSLFGNFKKSGPWFPEKRRVSGVSGHFQRLVDRR